MTKAGIAADAPGLRRTLRLIQRGLRRRCPNCGAAGLFRSWLRLHPHCEGCGLLVDRGEEDYFLGAYTVNFVTAEVLLALFLLGTVVATWPAVPWSALLYGGVALMILAPIAFFPLSRTLWFAIDLAFRPAVPDDFAEGGGVGG